MKYPSLIIAILMLWCSTHAQEELHLKPFIVYSGGNVETILSNNITYPKFARKSNMSGDVIFSFKIDQSGKTTQLRVASSPAPLLTEVALDALNLLDQNWSTEENRDTTQEYLHIFRFRILKDTKTADHTQRSAKQIDKQKWEKALRFNDLALEENQYDARIWHQRARILRALDSGGVAKAEERAFNFGQQVVSNVLISTEQPEGATSNGAQTPIDF